ncbi:probable ATP-dependent RNA helicase DDX60-like isoform X2 [Trichechus manatus latirostris]|uniref:Probable ATP-dependent RNA helicase DDX60-like isoform X2 n=1 Tax=Trichechus manatus latirostris TaxID=127582 RepID=A0A2Y9G1H6_TRIMA|nr:probable ATP-dependent RNA helicase DDX60-like isoform X2 [Trichechus manatus latirostris]
MFNNREFYSKAYTTVTMGLRQHTVFLKKMTQFILQEMPKARYSSLLNDFVESNYFVIDGDSLLVTCLGDKSFKRGQDLHFFYLVECYLVDLMRNGAQFGIIFFEDAECAYFPFPELLPLRTALILHLQHNTNIDVQTEISGCLSLEWELFLEERHPYFLIVSDEGLNDLQTHLFNFLIIHSWGMGVHVVLSSGQESDSLKLYAYIMQSTKRNQKFSKENQMMSQSAYKSLIQHLEEDKILALTSHFGHLRWEDMVEEAHETIFLLRQLWPQGSDIRSVLCVTLCSLSLGRYHCFLENKKKRASDQETSVRQVDTDCSALQEVEDLCRLHCLSIAFLLRLPLSQRAQTRVITSHWIQNIQTFLKMKKWCEYFILRNISKFGSWNLNLKHLSDLNDEHLLKNIAFFYETENVQEIYLNLGDFIKRDYEHLWNSVSHLVKEFNVGKPFPLRTTAGYFLGKTSSPIQEISSENMSNLGFIPMTSAIIDMFLGDTLKDLPFLKSDDPVVTSLDKPKKSVVRFRLRTHTTLSDDYDMTKCHFDEKSTDSHYVNHQQKKMAYQRFYGKSLESVSAKVIVTQTSHPEEESSRKKTSHDTKPKKLTKKQTRRLMCQEQKEEELRNDLVSSIHKEMRENLNSGIKKLEDCLKSCSRIPEKLELEMVGLTVCFETWKEHCRGEGKISKDLSIAVHMMERIYSLLQRYEGFLLKQDYEFIAKCLKYLGFNDMANSLDPTLQMTDKKKKKKDKYSIDIGPARFQLQYTGHCLMRDEREDLDPRVQEFIPDAWQRELLDVVDNNESAVVVAPTSSGKTYASYYCMEKVLKESDDGVVVYVAPTKALVGQVAATVQNRFTKTLPNDTALCGVYTPDYRCDALNCQVLVTVPACFEILLLAPHRQYWVERIRYVIFDEVHCLGGEIGGKYWERILVMIQCPFLVLSATISNPAHLTEWLKSVKQYWKQADKIMEEEFISKKKSGQRSNSLKDNLCINQSYEVRLVIYGERYNDLEKHVCSVKHDDVSFDHYHPCAAVTTDYIEKYGFPCDLTLSPRESIQLYDVMVQVWNTWPRAQELDPEKFSLFKNKAFIKKLDARKYEEILKAELTSWVKNGNIRKAERVLENLSPESVSDSKDMVKMFPLLVEKLRKLNKLPAIVFGFRNGDLEAIAGSLCTFLEEKPESKSPLRTDECHSYDADIAKCLKKEKEINAKQNKIKANDQQKARKLERKLTYTAEHIHFLKNLKKIQEVPQDCTYGDVNALDTKSLKAVFEQVESTRNGKKLKTLAQRGIGFHHNSMYFKEKEFVEILFAKGFIKVVTATGTLALGIHMPCKSVVFVQDSVYLDGLNYRQMSGRAGRRGQDLLGDVYFFGIPLPKIERLMTSNVPELRGQFPLSTTLVLRLMLLASKTDNANAKVLSVLKHSLLSYKQPKVTKMLKLYFLFSLQFLVKEGYLNQKGKPMRFARLVARLCGHEPSNFIFVSFLERGLFHKLCQPTRRGFPQNVVETLMLVLANLFGRKYIPVKSQDANFRFTQSEVILDELPEDFKAALQEYNLKVAKDFASFLLISSKLVNVRNECRLPLSRIKFTGEEYEDSQLVSNLMNCKEGRVAISPFACLSGNTDGNLLQPEIVNHVVLRTVGSSVMQAPVLWSQKIDNQGRRMPLSAYALDFYKHGSLTELTRDTGMSPGELLRLLKDFAFYIKTISYSLSELCENKDDNVVLAFRQLSQIFYEKLQKVQN